MKIPLKQIWYFRRNLALVRAIFLLLRNIDEQFFLSHNAANNFFGYEYIFSFEKSINSSITV